MEPSLLMWGISTLITVSGYMTDLCDDNPPNLQHATYRALQYKTGTILNCGCERGFRRLSNFMRCAGNSSHASWENKCQCISTSSKSTEGQVTPKPKEQKEMQSQTPPMDQGNLPGDEEEPQASTHAPPGRDTSCPLITTSATDFHKLTEAATTVESFIFTTEYQIAVAGCVLLLIGVLLLSGLTWRRRWRKRRRTI
ncbi:interleukin-2 receptor subunit alpha [Mirounga leonina]|uniref:interleukin-2 receptor subunit alpha n=1 Tax=Mirounga leonina TaxID=9715 RepID=UPI00156BF1A4|nr:interleukin-2 receptor subunit alpha [Mirounga leonina]